MVKELCIPDGVRLCRDRLWEAGWPTYPVGGCVRDLLLGRTPGDFDLTTAARPETVMALFPRTVPTGVRHGTVTVLTGDGAVEVTTFRRESGYTDGRHPGEVRFDATLEEDLARRDFTINAMALPPDGAVIDPFGGRQDLRRELIRCVGEPEQRFAEDALRMFRGVRFAAQLGFELQTDTARGIWRCAGLAGALSHERVRGELEKILCSPRPGWARMLFDTGLMRRYGCIPQGAFLTLSRLPRTPAARWAGFCAVMGEEGPPLLAALRLDRKTIRACSGGFRLWKRGLPQTDAEWRRALWEYGVGAAWAGAWMGDWAGRASSRALERVLGRGECWSVRGLALSGSDLAALGYRGAAIGAAQRRLLAYVLEEPSANTPARLRAYLRERTETTEEDSIC